MSSRVIVISFDESFGKKLTTALTAAGGAVELHRTPKSLQETGEVATLCIVHVGEELAIADVLPRLDPSCRVVVLLLQATLVDVVALMRQSQSIAGILTIDDFDPRRLYLLSKRILGAEILGLDGVLKSGTQIYSELVRDFADHSDFLARLPESLGRLNVPSRFHAQVEQCADEMLMNALYDAPVDIDGRAIFANVSIRKRVTMRIEQTVEVQYACDDTQLALAVRDSFGSLERESVVRVLHKCLHAAQKIDTKPGGAGVGLYLVANTASTVTFSVIPGLAAEVVCTFDLEASRQQLAHFGFYTAPADVTGTLVSGRRPPDAMRPVVVASAATGRRRIVVAACAVVAIGIGVVALASRQSGTVREHATVVLDSRPAAAVVEIDGKVMGETPLTLTSLAPRTTVSLVFKRDGYQPATARLEVPAAGERGGLVQDLAHSEDVVRVRFTSDPPGARVIDLDAAKRTISRTYTPAEVFVDVNKAHRFMLTMPSRVPIVFEPFTPPRGTRPLEKHGVLVEDKTAMDAKTRPP